MPDPGAAQPTPSLIEAFSQIAQHVQSSEDPDDSMQRITETARDAIQGCDSASLSLLTPDGAVTRAATDQLARAALLAAGFGLHKRGEWRRKRRGDEATAG